MPPRPAPEVPPVPEPGAVEEGAFAFATCEECGWRGPARRSRERARKDLTRHQAADGVHAGAG